MLTEEQVKKVYDNAVNTLEKMEKDFKEYKEEATKPIFSYETKYYSSIPKKLEIVNIYRATPEFANWEETIKIQRAICAVFAAVLQ